MTLQPINAPALRRRTVACALAALVALIVGAAAAHHAHDEHSDQCSICAATGVDDAGVPSPASPPSLATGARQLDNPVWQRCQTPLRAYLARAPPLSC